MPHQCTSCERTFPDGSKAMLGGCPDCGGNKFQFHPESQSSSADDDILEAPSEPIDGGPGEASVSGEDVAQASARRSVVSPDELPPIDDREAVLEEIARDAETPQVEQAREKPDLATLRQELNDQFESIKIVAPGEYELNLMELYDREEYIIALEEDGRYVIDVPTGFGEGDRDPVD